MYEQMRKQLIVHLARLPETGWSWRGALPRSLLESPEMGTVAPLPGLEDDAEWDVTLEREGNAYLLRGAWRMRIARDCSRCTARFAHEMRGETDREYRIVDAEEAAEGAEDALLPPGEIDLLDIFREDVWLAWEPFVLCRPDCRGLCPGCGQDLNVAPCDCGGGDEDHPFAELAKLKFDRK